MFVLRLSGPGDYTLTPSSWNDAAPGKVNATPNGGFFVFAGVPPLWFLKGGAVAAPRVIWISATPPSPRVILNEVKDLLLFFFSPG
jgi:hypothetical protein